MKENKSGSIIHISSIEGLHPTKFMSAYNISKAALIMLTKKQCINHCITQFRCSSYKWQRFKYWINWSH